MTQQRHPLREPMVWLMIGLPAVAVVAGIALVVIAVRSGSSDAVIDTVQRTAQIQTTELGPDERAKALKLSAVLRIAKGDAIELLPVSGDFMRNEPLTLVLSHPSDASQDRRVELKPTELGWHGKLPVDASHDWLLQLSPADAQWRLKGRLHARELAAHLGPALPAQ